MYEPTDPALNDWIDLARSCRECPLSGYQTPPITFAGYFQSPYLVIGQNPGEIRPTDWGRLSLAKLMKKEWHPARYTALYHHDFETSRGAHAMGSIFGTDWINSGEFCFTNVVLCRTKGNVKPSDDSLEACIEHNISPFIDLWTANGIAKTIVLMGRLAQMLTIRNSMQKVWEIPHYARWAVNNQVDVLRKQWEETYK